MAFLRREMAPYFLDNIRKIGRVGVKASLGAEEPLPVRREFQELSGVVASARLDCLVGLLCRTSREKAAGLITAGAVQRNPPGDLLPGGAGGRGGRALHSQIRQVYHRPIGAFDRKRAPIREM